MAEPVPLTKEELASKLVQEIAKQGNGIPEGYLHKNGFPEAIDAPDLWWDNLLIDLSLLSSSTPELAKLRSALSEWGCFQVINHGIESSFLEDLVEVSKQFFALPLDEKLKYCSTADDVFQGYGSDAVFAGAQTMSWNDRLFLTLYPEENRKLQFWPTKPEKFRGMIDEYSKKLATIMEALFKAMARSLNLEEDCFLKHQGKQGPITGRFCLYPRCPCPEQVLGVKPHSDGTTIAFLLPEKEVDGLQVLKDDRWYKVPVIPGALFVNFGDIGEVMTNGEFKSVIHRVVTNAVKDRISVAAFCSPENTKEIGPLKELVISHQPELYKRFNNHEFRRIFFESYAQGLRTIDALKL